jgi:branched-chain amino acid aminotransferase
MLFTIASPVGPYYPEGWKAVKLLADDRYVRAWPGGTGGSKLGGYVDMIPLCNTCK